MYSINQGTTKSLSDVTAFLKSLNTLGQSWPSAAKLFDPESELIVTRAPGRLDVMGGIADYSGSLVLELPILEATLVALQRDSNRILRVVSSTGATDGDLIFEMPLNDFENHDGPVDYEVARQLFQHDQGPNWAAYVAGVFLVLMRERFVNFREGARILISSRVPGGKGVSSSAALEVSVMQAVAAAFELQIEPREMAILCQKVENLVVGAPCGVMDQMTASCGEAGRLLALLCQPAEFRGLIEIPDDLVLSGLDSGVYHSVAGANYGSVRVGTFMGYRIIAELAGLKVNETGLSGHVQIEDPLWGGYLCNITPSEFEQSYDSRIPDRIGGAEFLARYQGITDPVTSVVKERGYEVRRPTAHAIYENHRVRAYAELLGGRDGILRLELLGELMYQSHASYSACGLGSEGTDRLVALVREAGPARGCYGARITGGGSGGTVAVLSRRGAESAIAAVADRYARETGYQPYIFAGSSPGSAAFGHLKLRKRERDIESATNAFA